MSSPIPSDYGENHWKLVFVGSRFTTDPESRYAPIEGEALAAVYGLQRCRMFVMGAPDLTLAVDHKPLVHIFNDRELCSITNTRVLQLKEKTMMYHYKIVNVPGKSKIMLTSDVASRYPVGPTNEEAPICEASISAFVSHQTNEINAVDWETVQTHTSCDSECSFLTNIIAQGFPATKESLPADMHIYWSMRDDLYSVDGVPFKGKKMLVPKALRPIVLEGLHSAHQGTSSMLVNARKKLFRPGLDAAVRLYRAQCRQCNEQTPSQRKEPTIESPPP